MPTPRPEPDAGTPRETGRRAADEADRPEEATFVVIPREAGAARDEEDVATFIVSKEEALRLTERAGATKTRPVEDTAAGAAPPFPGEAPSPGHRDRSAEPTFVPPAPGSSDVSFSDAGAHAAGEADPLCEASDEETEFFRSTVRAGRGTRRYSLESVRDAGGMGRVLQVLDLDLGRRMAMKILLPVWRSRHDLLSSFTTEARITGFLEHPNIIPVHDLGLAREAGLYYTMKLVEGESLHAVIRRLQAHEPDTVARYTTFALLGIFRKVCDAVTYAHSNRLLHLDIKPHNVLLGRYGEVFLIDWGLARVCGEPLDEADPVKQEFLARLVELARARGNQIAGTPAFMSPEQACGDSAAIDERSDVFLLGATLYHMFTLSPPYMASGLAQALALARRCEIEPPQARSPERQIPAEIARIITKATSRDKEARHGSVAELAAEVDEVMSGRWRPETRRRFGRGELLMKQGDAAEESYVILSGRVSVYTEVNGEQLVLRECGKGEIVGEMALVSHEPRSASVAAVEDTVVAVVTKQRLSEQLDSLPPYMAGMVSILVSRLRDSSPIHRS